MIINSRGLALLKKFEGLRLTAYRDVGGVWTIGYGHTGSDVHEGLTITAEQAEELLEGDLLRFEQEVGDVLQVPVTENEFSAMVCFAYNVGIRNFEHSTLLHRVNDADFRRAADEFLRWNKVNGQVVAGLSARRGAERELFLTPPERPSVA